MAREKILTFTDLMMDVKDNQGKVYLPDTNVLILNAFAPFILSGNEIPDEAVPGQLEKAMQRLDLEYDRNPNQVLISDIVEKELDTLTHQGNQRLRFAANQANRVIEMIMETGEILEHDIPETVTYRLDNNALIHFVTHNEVHFQQDNKRFDPDMDDRILYSLLCFRNEVSPLKKDLLDFDVRFVSQDVNARNRARRSGIPVQEFWYETVKYPTQKFRGIEEFALGPEIMEELAALRKLTIEELALMTNPHLKDADEDQVKQYLRQKFKPNQLVRIGIQPAAEDERPLKDDRSVSVFKVVAPENGHYVLRNLNHLDEFLDFIERERTYATRVTSAMHSFESSKKNPKDLQEELEMVLDAAQHVLKTNEVKRISTRANNARNDAAKQRIIDEVTGLMNQRRAKGGDTTAFDEAIATIDKNQKRVITPPMNTDLIPIKEQRGLVELLANPKIPLVSVIGPPGTGKTLFATYVGMYFLQLGQFSRIRYMRPLVGADEGLGFLPGEKMQKIDPWIQPFKDDFKEILRYWQLPKTYRFVIDDELSSLEEIGCVEYDTPTHLQGRTLHDEYIIFDEGQLVTRDQMKMLLTRVGKNSKIVVLGDPMQVKAIHDKAHLYLNERNAGINHLPERLSGSNIYAHITLPDDIIQRSGVAKLASKRL